MSWRYGWRSVISTQRGVKLDLTRRSTLTVCSRMFGSHFGVTKDDHPDWKSMNRDLDLKGKVGPAHQSRNIARHLNDRALQKLERMDRNALLRLAREAVELILTKSALIIGWHKLGTD